MYLRAIIRLAFGRGSDIVRRKGECLERDICTAHAGGDQFRRRDNIVPAPQRPVERSRRISQESIEPHQQAAAYERVVGFAGFPRIGQRVKHEIVDCDSRCSNGYGAAVRRKSRTEQAETAI